MKTSFVVTVGLICFLLLAGALFLLSPSGESEKKSKPAQPVEMMTICTLAGDAAEALCASPSLPCEKLRNQKTTEIALDESFMTINVDSSETFLLLEEQGGWYKIQVLEPAWLANTHIGWLPAEKLSCRQVEKRSAQQVAVEVVTK